MPKLIVILIALGIILSLFSGTTSASSKIFTQRRINSNANIKSRQIGDITSIVSSDKPWLSSSSWISSLGESVTVVVLLAIIAAKVYYFYYKNNEGYAGTQLGLADVSDQQDTSTSKPSSRSLNSGRTTTTGGLTMTQILDLISQAQASYERLLDMRTGNVECQKGELLCQIARNSTGSNISDISKRIPTIAVDILKDYIYTVMEEMKSR